MYLTSPLANDNDTNRRPMKKLQKPRPRESVAQCTTHVKSRNDKLRYFLKATRSDWSDSKEALPLIIPPSELSQFSGPHRAARLHKRLNGSRRVHGRASRDTHGDAPPRNNIPEFAHLQPAEEQDVVCSSAPLHFESQHDHAKGITTRDYAKTPIFEIGQTNTHVTQCSSIPETPLSAAMLAEQYRALLASPFCFFMCTPPPNQVKDARAACRSVEETIFTQTKDFCTASKSESASSPMSQAKFWSSETTDDETLVGCEKGTTCSRPSTWNSTSDFKWGAGRLAKPTMPLPHETPDLGILFDLLCSELSSTAHKISLPPSSKTSALEISVLIEAYEKLQDNIGSMELGWEHLEQMEIILDLWLGTLYTVYGKLLEISGADVM